jgi:hypothetical protein
LQLFIYKYALIFFYHSFYTKTRCLASYTLVCDKGIIRKKELDSESSFLNGNVQKVGTVLTKRHTSRKSSKVYAGTNNTLNRAKVYKSTSQRSALKEESCPFSMRIFFSHDKRWFISKANRYNTSQTICHHNHLPIFSEHSRCHASKYIIIELGYVTNKKVFCLFSHHDY